MKKLLWILSLAIGFGCSDIEAFKPEDTFIKFFGSDGSQLELKDMCLANEGDGSMILFGTVASANEQGVEHRDIYILKISSDGDLLQEKQLDGARFDADGVNTDDAAGKITPVDGGYLIIGTSSAGPTDIAPYSLIVRQIDNDLNEDAGWVIIKDENPNDAVEESYWGIDADISADGGIVVAGYTNANGDNDYFYSKIGGTNDEWSRIQERSNSDDLLTGMIRSGNNYVLFGQTDARSDDGETGINVERTVIDAEGVIQNSAIYGISASDGLTPQAQTSWDDVPNDIIEKPGGYTIVGTSSLGGGTLEFPFLMNVDLQGTASSEHMYFDDLQMISSDVQGRGIGVTYGIDNNPVVIGQLLEYPDRGDEVMIMKTNQSGVVIGEILNFGLINGSDAGVKALTGLDGSIYVGANYDFGGNISQFALLKFNLNLELKK